MMLPWTAVTCTEEPFGTDTFVTTPSSSGERFLYAANFTKGRVDIFDNAFNSVAARQLASPETGVGEFFLPQTEPFKDDMLPRHFAPFNVQAIGNDIVVTYAEQPSTMPVWRSMDRDWATSTFSLLRGDFFAGWSTEIGSTLLGVSRWRRSTSAV